jgi:hypothetical protein
MMSLSKIALPFQDACSSLNPRHNAIPTVLVMNLIEGKNNVSLLHLLLPMSQA